MYQAPKWTHVTLPSVEGVNILRDPPKSVFTRRINKVGVDDSLLDLIDGSGDRVCEAINTYQRGVNPMVEVNYSNANNPYAGGTSHISRNAQAYLPYRIMDSGAFRAPIIAPTELLPLSRLPRVHTFASANPGFIDFTKKIACGTNSKNTKFQKLQGEILATPSIRREKLVQSEPVRTRTSLKAEAQSNPRGYTKIVFENDTVKLQPSRPNAIGYTNLSGFRNSAQENPETTIIKRNLKLQGYEPRPSMPQEEVGEVLVSTGILPQPRAGNRQTRIV